MVCRRLLIFLALLIECVRGGAAMVPAAARGVDYIVGCQRADGLWSEDAAVDDGLAAIVALWGLAEPTAAARLLGQSALLLRDGLSDDELPGVLTAYVCGGCVDSSPFAPFAVAEEGGWCMALGSRADVLSTVLVAEALLRAFEPDRTALAVARDYLLAQRSADGYWRLCSQAAAGDLRLTARVAGVLARIDALLLADGCDAVTAKLPRDLAARLVGAAGQTVAGVGASDPTASALVDMAWLLLALAHVGCWEDTRDLYRLLQAAQHADGSWGGDGDASRVLRTTCAVVGALRCFTISGAGRAPDLAVPSSSLRLQALVGDSPWCFSAMVFNDGQAESLPCAWKLHCGPPAVNTLLARGQLSALVAGDSCKLQAEFTCAVEPSVLYLLIDPDAESGDGCRANNVACLECRPLPAADGLSLWLSPLNIRSEGAPEMLLLRPGCGVMISVLVVADGSGPVSSLRAVLLDNGRDYLREDIALGSDGLAECRWEWFPEPGWHELVLRVLQGEEVVAERMVDVEVCNDDALLRISPGAQGESAGLPQFGAAEYVSVRFYAAETAAVPELWVVDEHDERLDTPLVSASLDGRYTWHTGVHAPGRYRVYAQMAGAASVVSADFVIVDSCELRELSIQQPDFAERIGVGDTVQAPVVVSLARVGNSSRCLQVTWSWSGPGGVVAEATAGYEVDCAPGALTQQLAMPEPAALSFPQAGKYVFTAVVTDGETELTAERSAQAIALPELTVQQTVQPESLGWEACEVAVCTSVMLRAGTGSAGGMHIPDLGPLPPLPDDASGGMDIVLSGICNGDGQIIEKGALAARVLYGRCGETAPVTDVSGEGVFAIADGVCHLIYSPGGSALSAGMSAPVIIALYDPQTELGVGCIEVHVEGGDETNN